MRSRTQKRRELYASWGVDFVKVDDISRPYHADEITGVRLAIESSGRPMVLSLSPGSTPIAVRYHVRNNADMWRISDDFWDTWPQLKAQFELAQSWLRFTGEGHWADLDMLPIGIVGTRDGDAGGKRRSRLTPDELRTMMTLWCLCRSPLVLGGDVTTFNQFETGLITDKELLDIDQNGTVCQPVSKDRNTVILATTRSANSRRYVGLFNLSDTPRDINCSWAQLDISSPMRMREVWTNQDLVRGSGGPSAQVGPHGVALIAIEP